MLPPYSHSIIKLTYSCSQYTAGALLRASALLTIAASSVLSGRELVLEWVIIKILSFNVRLVFILDYMSLFFLRTVFLISAAVCTFRVSYMRGEKFLRRFLGILTLFIASMALLILRPNVISLLLGWDGLGVTSYLLVIYYQRRKSYSAGIITALTNRLGDVGLLICIAILASAGSWSFLFYSLQTRPWSGGLVIILVTAACTKSAQLPFSSWLPAAIAAPTPVSALVHSSTLVTAGVYLIIRFNYIFTRRRRALLLFYVGSLTIIMAGVAAMRELDIKKIIALRTLRQLGVIMMALGLMSPLLSFFHLLSHAYFKAMLFICAGRIIHTIKDYQDIRTMGSAEKSSVKVMAILMLANLRLCGMPFLSGFYSKDLILEALLLRDFCWIAMVIGFLGTSLTVAYSIRIRGLLINKILAGEKVNTASDRDTSMLTGMAILVPFSVVGGFSLRRQLVASPMVIVLPMWLKLFIPAAIFTGVFLGIAGLSLDFPAIKPVSNFTSKIWFIPLLFRVILSHVGTSYAKKTAKVSESAWLLTIVSNSASNVFTGRRRSLLKLRDLSLLASILITALFLGVFR